MISFPNCKINLGLNIIRKRTDGYHDLETVFYPVQIKDILEIIALPESKNQATVQFSQSGLHIDGDANNNLCVKAYHLLKKDFPSLPAIQMHLHKVIPMGAGLGGGSADGAFALRLLNDKLNLHLSNEQLIQYALQLGSDCTFFILNKPCYATSRGEVMEKIELDLSAYKFAIVNPGIHVSTAWAFSTIAPHQPKISIKEIIKQPINDWKNLLQNDFEAPVMKAFPAIQQIKDTLCNAGAAYVSMTGSGSTVFGIFEKNIPVQLKFPENYFVEIQ